MKVFDFNIHLPCQLGTDTNQAISNETLMSAQDLASCFHKHLPSFSTLSNANFMLFNQQLFNNDATLFTKSIQHHFESPLFTALLDFRQNDPFSYMDKAIAQGVKSIKFHSYHQKISEADYGSIARIASYAENHGLIICIDTSYGTTKMYSHDNLKLAAFVADTVKKTPIILLHSGGARIMEAMLLADAQPNIFLESSFSLSYYKGSSCQQDMAFAYKKIGSHRVLFGSDFPYISIEQSIADHMQFFEKNHFSSSQIEQIFYNNAADILSK